MRSGSGRLLAGVGLLVVLVLVAGASLVLHAGGRGDRELHAPRLGPSLEHPFGTDHLGRDVAILVVDGAPISLSVAMIAVALATVIGGTVGAAAGIRGGVLGGVLMRITDVVAAVPQVVLVIVIAALWGGHSTMLVILTIGLTTWMGTARLTRAEALRVGAADFVQAAKATGAGGWHVAIRHFLPHLLPVLLVAGTLRIGNAILLESSLGFLGLGVAHVTPTWGRLVWEGFAGLRDTWWVSVAGGAAITWATVGANLLGDGVRDLVSREVD